MMGIQNKPSLSSELANLLKAAVGSFGRLIMPADQKSDTALPWKEAGKMVTQGVQYLRDYKPEMITFKIPDGDWDRPQPLRAGFMQRNHTRKLIAAIRTGHRKSTYRGVALIDLQHKLTRWSFAEREGFGYERDYDAPKNHIVLRRYDWNM